MNRLKGINRFFRDLFFLHIFKQDDETLTSTANSIFVLAVVLLFISVLITAGLTFILAFVLHHHIETAFMVLNDYSMHAGGLLLFSLLLTLFIKVGAFAKQKAVLVWAALLLVVIAAVIMAVVLISLTFGELERLLLTSAVSS